MTDADRDWNDGYAAGFMAGADGKGMASVPRAGEPRRFRVMDDQLTRGMELGLKEGLCFREAQSWVWR